MMVDRSQTDAAADEVEDGRQAITTRSVVIGLAAGIPLSLLFLWLAIRGVDFNEVWAALKSANVGLVLASIPFLLSLVAFQGLRWRHLVVAPSLPRRRAFVVLMFVGVAISNVVPGRPGDIARGIWLGRLGRIPAARSLTSVGVDRGLDVATVLVLLLVSIPFVDPPTWLLTLAAVGATVVLAMLVVLIVAWWLMRARDPLDLAAGMERQHRSWLRHQASGIVRGLAVLSRPREFGAAVMFSFVGWVLNATGTWLIGESLGLNIGFAGALLVTSVIALGSAIPSSPGMIGTFQWLAVASLGVLGVAQATAIAFAILLQAVTYVPTTLGGVPEAWWLSREGAREQRASESKVKAQ